MAIQRELNNRNACQAQHDLMVRFHLHLVARYHIAITPDEAAILWMKHRDGKNPKHFRDKFNKYLN